jgi:hypothetical protein
MSEEVQRHAAVREGVGLEVVTIIWMVVEAAIASAARRKDLPQRDVPRALIELMGHARLETTWFYTLPTKADRERALDALLTDR